MFAKLSELHFDVSLFFNCGEKVLKRHIIMGQIWDKFSVPSPHNWRTTIHWNVVLTVSHTPWDMWSMWKTVKSILKFINVLHLQGEGPKLHWNSVDSGSQSATYTFCKFQDINIGFFKNVLVTIMVNTTKLKQTARTAFNKNNHILKRCRCFLQVDSSVRVFVCLCVCSLLRYR